MLNFKKSKKSAISDEVARDQVELLCDYYDITKEDIEDAESNGGTSKLVEKVCKHIQRGYLSISEVEGDLKITHNLKKSDGEIKLLNYRVIDGACRIAMKEKGEKDYYGRIYAMMGSLSEIGEDAIKQLKGIDLIVVETLGLLFLAA
jgi:hypothetical protein